jgi:hypothetical protein
MNTALERRLQALERDTQQPEPLRITLEFVCPKRGTVAARLPDGRHLERGEDETEAAFVTRVGATGD